MRILLYQPLLQPLPVYDRQITFQCDITSFQTHLNRDLGFRIYLNCCNNKIFIACTARSHVSVYVAVKFAVRDLDQ